jgi:hypothetical protein
LHSKTLICTLQEDVYHAAGIDELVAAAAAGYHATVFAYGQVGCQVQQPELCMQGLMST